MHFINRHLKHKIEYKDGEQKFDRLETIHAIMAAKQKKKELEETVVKCSLKSIWACKDDDRNKLTNYIEKLVFAVSQHTYNMSLALNYLLVELFQVEEEIETVQVPELEDQTFIRQMMLGTSAARKPDPAIVDFYQRHPDFLPHPPRYHSDRNVYTHAAIKYRTNLVNHVFMNFEKFQRRYHKALVKAYDWGLEDRLAMLYSTNGWSIQNYAGIYPMRSELSALVALHRRVLGCDETTTFQETWYKRNVSSCIKYFALMLRFLQTQPDEKLFTMVPLCGIQRHFITLDRTTTEAILKHLFPDAKYTYELERWVDVNAYKGKHCTFSGTLDTDGVSVCIHFTRPKKQTTRSCVCPEDVQRVLSIDPGRVNLYSIGEKVGDQYTYHKFTRKAYRCQSGIVFHDQKTQRWYAHLQYIMEGYTPKTADLALFQNYYDRVKNHYDVLWSEKLRRRWGQASLRIYGGKKRAFANFWKQYQDDRSVLVLYGSAKFAPTGRGEVAVPVGRAFQEVKHRFAVQVVDEFRTSVIHHECQQPLQTVRIEGDSKPLRGLHWCSSTNCCKFVGHDANATINIHICGISATRPTMLCRGHSRLPPMTLGRII